MKIVYETFPFLFSISLSFSILSAFLLRFIKRKIGFFRSLLSSVSFERDIESETHRDQQSNDGFLSFLLMCEEISWRFRCGRWTIDGSRARFGGRKCFSDSFLITPHSLIRRSMRKEFLFYMFYSVLFYEWKEQLSRSSGMLLCRYGRVRV
jgi:hypothetical protein